MTGRKRILVLDASCNAATTIVQSLGRAGHDITLAGEFPDAFSFRSRYPLKRLVYPSSLKSKKAFQEWFLRLWSPELFDYVIPATDLTIYPLREISFERDLPGVILPPKGSFPFFFDKSKTIALAMEHEVPVPVSVVVRDGQWNPDDYSSFPYYVKPARSKVWVGDSGFDLDARLVRTSSELFEAVTDAVAYGEVLIQRYEQGDGVGIELLCKEGEILLSFAHRRVHEYPLTGGGSTYRVSIDSPPALFQSSKRLVKAANWSGVAMVEFKQDGEAFSLMEVNGRFWGSLPLSYRSGVDFPLALIRSLSGEDVSLETPYRRGTYSRKFSTDFSWFKRNLLADKNDPYTKTRPIGKTLLEYSRFLTGKDHWDHLALSDPMPTLSEMGTTLGRTVSTIGRMAGKRFFNRSGKSGSESLRRESLERLRTIAKSRDHLNILVLCHGNICRSPLVEHCLKTSLPAERFSIRSSGFIPRILRQSPREYARLAKQEGIDLSDHRSSLVNEGDLSWADLVVIMDGGNYRELSDFDPSALVKTVRLGAWSHEPDTDILDPYGEPASKMLQIISHLKESCQNLSRDLLS
jgi:protein-tyrosine-phosphatase/predicted ATP-grasp superfamily ATP-dependent carboligase